MNFPMTFHGNGHFDNESLQTEYLCMMKKIELSKLENQQLLETYQKS